VNIYETCCRTSPPRCLQNVGIAFAVPSIEVEAITASCISDRPNCISTGGGGQNAIKAKLDQNNSGTPTTVDADEVSVDGADQNCAWYRDSIVTTTTEAVKYIDEFGNGIEGKTIEKFYFTCSDTDCGSPYDSNECYEHINQDEGIQSNSTEYISCIDDPLATSPTYSTQLCLQCNKTRARGGSSPAYLRSSGTLTANVKCCSCPNSSIGPDCDPLNSGGERGNCYLTPIFNQPPLLYKEDWEFRNPVEQCDINLGEYSTWSQSPTAYGFINKGGGQSKDFRKIRFRVNCSPPPATCYLKIWFILKIQKFDGGKEINGSILCEPQNDFQPTTSYQIIPIEFVPSGNPCINNTTKSICGEENIYKSDWMELSIVDSIGGGSTSNAFYESSIKSGDGETVQVAIHKFSYLPEYEPEDPSPNYPFETNTVVREKVDGFPTPRYEADSIRVAQTIQNVQYGQYQYLPWSY
jgi:hypothetical protein